MAAFHIDTDGNIWIGQNTSDVFTTALAQTDPNDSSLPRVKFYVTKAGALNAISGEIGGIEIDKDGIQSDNYDESTNTGWRLDNLNGVGNYFDINIILDSSLSDDPSTGRTTLDFGNSKIFDFNNDLFLDANDDVIVKSVLRLGYASDGLSEPRLVFGNSAAASGSQQNPIMGIESTLVQADTYGGNANHLARELNFSNGSGTAVMIMNSVNDTVEFTGDIKLDASSDIYIGTDPGSNGDVLTKSGGNIVWASQSGSSHAASDHHSDLDSRYVLSSSHSHSGLASSSHGTHVSYGGNGSASTVSRSDHTHSGGGITSVGMGSSGTGFLTSVTTIGNAVTLNTTNTDNSTIHVGSLDPSYSSSDIGNSSSDRFADIYAANHHGGIFYGTLINSSSQYVKENVAENTLGLDFINSMVTKEFNYITKDHSDLKYTGMIAEDLKTVLSDNSWDGYYFVEEIGKDKYQYFDRCSHVVACSTSEVENNYYCEDECCDEYFKHTNARGETRNYLHHTVEECEEYEVDGSRHPHINYYQFIGPLIKSIQELSTQISDLTARIEVLEG